MHAAHSTVAATKMEKDLMAKLRKGLKCVGRGRGSDRGNFIKYNIKFTLYYM